MPISMREWQGEVLEVKCANICARVARVYGIVMLVELLSACALVGVRHARLLDRGEVRQHHGLHAPAEKAADLAVSMASGVT